MIYPARFHHAASFFLHRSRAIFAAIDGGQLVSSYMLSYLFDILARF